MAVLAAMWGLAGSCSICCIKKIEENPAWRDWVVSSMEFLSLRLVLIYMRPLLGTKLIAPNRKQKDHGDVRSDK